MRHYTDEEIARVIHEANCALQAIQGDPVPSQPWESESQELRDGVIANVAYCRGGCTTAALHDRWLEDKRRNGWRHGPVKDPVARTHPCMVPYDQLPDYQRDKNRIFVAIVRALAHDML